MPASTYTFPTIRGIQAQRHYYLSMIKLREIPKLFYYNEEQSGLNPEHRAQRLLSRNRVPDITEYITSNLEDYIFSAITVSIDGEVSFSASDNTDEIGFLTVSMDANFIINDGQHRRAAIENAIKTNPDLCNEHIAVVFFIDRGLKRCQQQFADLNRHSVRPSKSLGVLYDHRDDHAIVIRKLVSELGVFKDIIEMEKNSLAKRSKKLFTLSGIYGATKALLEGVVELNNDDDNSQKEIDKASTIAIKFWREISRHIGEWSAVQKNKFNSSDIRLGYVHTYNVTLLAIGKVGNAAIKNYPKDWKKKLQRIKNIDWSKSNHDWEGRTMINGRFQKSTNNVLLTTYYIKKKLGLKPTEDEKTAEKNFKIKQ